MIRSEPAAPKLRPFVSPGSGLLFNAPEEWEETSDADYFQVIDPATDAQFTASAYQNPGLDPRQWADARFAVVGNEMPFLTLARMPYAIQGSPWVGFAAEYRGVFPGQTRESHYLLLCLHTQQKLISFTITASREIFAQNEDLYRRLLAQHLHLMNPLAR